MSSQAFSIGFGVFGPNQRGPITAGDVRLIEDAGGVIHIVPAHLAEPTPALAVPSLPVCTPAPRGFTVSWNGLDAAGQPFPHTLRSVEVHVTTSELVPLNDSTVRHTFSRVGGEYSFLSALDPVLGLVDTFVVRLAARNTSDVLGPPTEGVTVSIGQVEPIDIHDLSLTVNKFNTSLHLLY